MRSRIACCKQNAKNHNATLAPVRLSSEPFTLRSSPTVFADISMTEFRQATKRKFHFKKYAAITKEASAA
jgi:hypothetical protein